MYLDFEKHQKGYKPFDLTKSNIKANIGKKICYVDYIEPNRGIYHVKYGVIHSIMRSRIFLDEMSNEVDIRDIKEAGIEV